MHVTFPPRSRSVAVRSRTLTERQATASSRRRSPRSAARSGSREGTAASGCRAYGARGAPSTPATGPRPVSRRGGEQRKETSRGGPRKGEREFRRRGKRARKGKRRLRECGTRARREKGGPTSARAASVAENVGDRASGHAEERRLESGAVGNDATVRHAEKHERTRERCPRARTPSRDGRLGMRTPRGGTERQLAGYTQGLGRHLMPSMSRDFVCCCITGASAPGVRQLTCPCPRRCPTSWLMSIWR